MVEKKTIKGVIYLIFLTLGILAMLIVGNSSLLAILLVYIVMLIISYFVYKSDDFKEGLTGLSTKNFWSSTFYAIILTVGFYGLGKLAGFSIGLPRLPQSISEEIKNIVVLGFAPIVESIFFQGAMFAVLLAVGSSFIKGKQTRIAFALIGQAVLFSVAHLAAYINGIYNYPDFTQALVAISANTASFISAFIFAFVGMFFLLKPKLNNLWFIILLHFGLNLVIQFLLSIIYIS